MKEKIYLQASSALEELGHKAKLKPGDIIVIGCSTSEIIGSKIGTNSNPDIAGIVFQALYDYATKMGWWLAFQCCEHLNRAIVIERDAVPFAEPVNVVPQPKAGGSMATQAYRNFKNPVVLEEIKANAGLDIGFTLIGMHLKHVAVPVRTSVKNIGQAHVTSAITRPKLIGGARACYERI